MIKLNSELDQLVGHTSKGVFQINPTASISGVGEHPSMLRTAYIFHETLAGQYRFSVMNVAHLSFIILV